MKPGWEIKKLGEICEFENGDRGTNYPSKSQRTSLGIPFINAGHLTSDGLDKMNMDFISLEKFNSLGSGKIKNGDILFCLRGSLGKFAQVQELSEGAIASSLVIVRPKPRITNAFLLAYFESKLCAEMIKKYSNGAAQPNLSAGNLKNFIIPLPPLQEQNRIVSILDEAFFAIAKAKANAEQNLKNAKELFESYLHSIFSNKGANWVTSTIGDTCNLFTGGTPSRNRMDFFVDGNIKWLVSGDINQKIIYDCEGRITDLGLKNSNARYLPVNSVLIALNGQGKTRGTVAMLKTKATCNQSLVAIYPKNEKSLLPELLYANLEGRYNEIRRITGDSGNDRRGLNMPLIRKIKFSYPLDIEEQKRIIQELDILHSYTKKLEINYKQKLSDLEELKKSILQKAFSGELN